MATALSEEVSSSFDQYRKGMKTALGSTERRDV